MPIFVGAKDWTTKMQQVEEGREQEEFNMALLESVKLPVEHLKKKTKTADRGRREQQPRKFPPENWKVVGR